MYTIVKQCFEYLIIIYKGLKCFPGHKDTHPCPKNYFRCNDGITCRKLSKLCDGVNNCPDFSDEGPFCRKFTSPVLMICRHIHFRLLVYYYMDVLTGIFFKNLFWNFCADEKLKKCLSQNNHDFLLNKYVIVS